MTNDQILVLQLPFPVLRLLADSLFSSARVW
jgi:hypothetical protein